MTIKKMKKALSSIIMAAYLLVYAAPMGLCISTVPQIDATIQKPALRGAIKPTSLKLEGDISISKKNPNISLSLRDSDVKQVLRMFADKAGLNIIFHSSVDEGSVASADSKNSSTSTTSGKKVTLDLVNVPLNDAFKMVLQVTDLTYYIDDNTIIIASAATAKTLNLAKQELMTIPVKYVDAAIIADFLNKNIFTLNKPGLSNANIAVTNPGTNEILIFGTKNDYLMAKKIVAQFDTKPLEQTFIVNHSTPAEMSGLICKTLFKSYFSTNNTSGGSTSTTDGSAGENITTTKTAGISLGEGVIACTFNNSVAADGLASFHTNNMTITYFPQRGTINARGGSPQQIEMIKDFIAKNDKKEPQAYLELSIVELNESGMKEFDNTWRMYSEFFSGGFDGTLATNPNNPSFIRGDTYTSVPATSTTTEVLDLVTQQALSITNSTPATILQKYTGVPTLTYSINYLIQNQKGRVLANPRIMITNGKESTIDLSSDYVKTVTSQVITTTGSLTPVIQRTYNIANDDGIKVTLLPFISPEGYVTLNIKPDYATIKEKIYAPSSSGVSTDLAATLLQRRNLDLKNIRIKDGETLVIGGMIREEETKSVSKLPVLGDLPGVGMFFRNTGSTKTKQELVIMLTPKIIKDSEDIVDRSDTTL